MILGRSASVVCLIFICFLSAFVLYVIMKPAGVLLLPAIMKPEGVLLSPAIMKPEGVLLLSEIMNQKLFFCLSTS